MSVSLIDPFLLSRIILVIHFAWVLGIVLPIPLILIGAWRRWRWIRNPIFRMIHLSMIGIVALEALIGVLCPLTVWEQALRRSAGEVTYEGSFLGYWLGRLLYHDLEPWIFTLVYCFTAGLILILYILIPPQRKSAQKS